MGLPAHGFLSSTAPTWAVLLVPSATAIVVAGIASGPKWYAAHTKRLEWERRQAQISSELNAKLIKKIEKVARRKAAPKPKKPAKRRSRAKERSS